MRHETVKMYRYNIIIDGEIKAVEKPFAIDYKHCIEYYKSKGAKHVWVKFLGTYIWS